MVVELAAHASPAVFDRLRQDVFTETDRHRRGELLRALATARDVKQQTAALELMLDDRIDSRETRSVVFRSTEDINWTTAQQFVRDHKDELLRRIPSDSPVSGQAVLAYVFTEGCKADQRDEVADYVTRTFAGFPGGARTVRQAIEDMDQRLARGALIESELRGWLGTPATARMPR